MNFEELWPTLAVPGEFDAMDDCDQERWRGVVKEAFLMGAKEEREACAKIVEKISIPYENTSYEAVLAIRARSKS